MRVEEVLFVGQCDCCDYCSIEFNCPFCNEFNMDFDSGWMKDELYDGKVEDYNCEKCKTSLLLSYNKENYEFEIVVK